MTPLAWDRCSFLHEGAFYDTDEALGDRGVPFIDDAIERQDPLVVVASAETIASLDRHVGGALLQHAVLVADAGRWWQGDALRTLRQYTQAMRPLMAEGRPWRLIGEPTWLDAPGGRRWSRIESACNVTFAGLPYYSLCLHDLRRLEPASAAAARRTHPWTCRAGEVVPSADFVPPEVFVRSDEPAWTEAPAAAVQCTVRSTGEARDLLTSRLPAHRLGAEAADGLRVAVSELVANVLEHTRTIPTIRLWDEGDRTVVEVADTGNGFDARFAGYAPPDPSGVRGRGMWLARCLSDDLLVRSGPRGTTARILIRR